MINAVYNVSTCSLRREPLFVCVIPLCANQRLCADIPAHV